MFRKIAMIAVPTAAFALILCATGDSASQAFARGIGGHGHFSSHNFGHFNHFGYWGGYRGYGWGYPSYGYPSYGYSYPTYCSDCSYGYSYPSYYGYSYPSYYGWGYRHYGFNRNFGHNFGRTASSFRGGRR